MVKILNAAVESITNDVVRVLYLDIWPSAELERSVDADKCRVPWCLGEDFARSTILWWRPSSFWLHDDGGLTAIDHETYFLSAHPHFEVHALDLDFDVATLVYRSLSRNSASYLADDCRLVADARERRLRSTESRTCVVTRTHSTFGVRAFAAAGPGLWNSLPPHLRDADLPYSRFRQSLKTFFFG